MNWKRFLIAAITKKKYQSFLEDTKHPKDVRDRLWNQEIVPLLIQSHYWGDWLKNKSSLDLNDFPITEYEDYQEGLLSAQNQTIQPFNGEKLIFWSETSGTSGVRKFFPITSSFQKQFQRTMAPYIHSLTQRFSGFFKEKILYLVAVDTHKTTPAGIPAGWISNFNYRHLPSFIKRFYAMPDEVFASHETYNQWGPVYALASDLSAVFAVTPMVVDIFYQRCIDGFQDYLPYLLGHKKLPSHFPPLKITRKRLKLLQGLAKNHDLSFKQLWPSLEVVGCWTSGLCEYPAQQLQKLLGSEIRLVDGTYSATEGWFTVPLETNSVGGILHPGAHIVEFIPEGDTIVKENLLQCWELEVGKQYEVFLTTAMGFVRYRLRDIVKCTGYLNSSPKLEFCYKTQLLKLETCSITAQELQGAMQLAGLNMEPYWYFARNSIGNRIVLVTDETELPELLLKQLHDQLTQISPTYAHSVETEEVISPTLLQLPKEKLLAGLHGQTKPKLISQEVITER
ncbi:GH3 auxin-responsive promoter [Legionella norrlandica]|uniref:GH3 auxin-responsive promoter n=1 Tax=Legionella norrlandica TaxID=1498499 RepID=A0A0A2SW70_9GAMM|nr:GH3 auxin-responsive promoter family protein [Legionella norrlandica]KGP63966.1 GH3 auxin-responsive promoter [Legionella norrlandica]